MLFRYFILILTLFIGGIPLTTTAQNAEDIIPGTLSVKFTDAAVEAFDISTEDAFVTTGLSSVDQLNEQFDVTEMERIFRPAGRFEERHRAFGLHRWYTLTIPQDVGVQTAMDAYQADPNIEFAEPVYEKTFTDGYELGVEPQIIDMPNGPRAKGIPNDPFFEDQWHYDNTGQSGGTPGADISLPEAHDVQTGDPSVVVSVHDQGIQTEHEDLAANMWVNEGEIPDNGIDDDDNGFVDDVYGYNFADDQGTIIPGDHGTHVAGTVAAVTNNDIGVAGVAGGEGTPDSGVRVMSAQVFTGNTGGSGFAESYTYAADMGATISQNSWGYDTPGVFEQAVLDGIDYYIATAGSQPGAAMAGGLVIFAAGNSNFNAEWYPSYYEPTVSVASSGIDDQKSGFSNYGEWVDITAPGGNGASSPLESNVLSTLPGNSYGWNAGTSMACPHASGVAALIVSQNLSTTNTQVRAILEATTDDINNVNPGYEGLLGTGRINAAAAVGAEPDTAPPGVVTDLTGGIPDGESVTLTWTAPGDEGLGVQNYHARYALEPIENEDDWEAATVVLEAESMVPQESGETEELLVTGLTFETTYYFSVRSDDLLHLSDLSNSAEITTLAPPVGTVPTDPIVVEVEPEGTDSREYTIANAGPSTLSYTLNFDYTTEGLHRTPVPKPDLSDREEPAPRNGVEEDAPSGEPQRFGEGGPDAFGYRWIDSNEPNGPTYDWIDITETGTELELNIDDYEIVDLPFDFPFYENTFDWITIQSTGALVFEGAFVGYTNHPIPDDAGPNAIIAGFWDDLNPSSSTGGGAVYYDTLEDGRFVVSWVGVPRYPNQGSFTFQVILSPRGAIVTQYQEIDGVDNSATVGIESPNGTRGLEVVYNAPYVENELAIRFSVSALWAETDISEGQISAGESETLTLDFDAARLEPRTYTADMTVNTNEPGDGFQEYVIPITLTVEGIGTENNELDFEGTHRLSAVAPNPIAGVAATTLEVAEAQDVTVELFDVRGRKVTTLLESVLAARTAEEIALDAGTLAPGVYVLRISGETFSETRRVTVVR